MQRTFHYQASLRNTSNFDIKGDDDDDGEDDDDDGDDHDDDGDDDDGA